MDLYLDQGNTRLKWCLGDGAVQIGESLPSPTEHGACAWWTSSAPAQAQALEERLHALGWRTQQATVRSELWGLRQCYQPAQDLGVDRWLAMLASWRRHQCALLTVSAGTALTLDAVTDRGEHLGGQIAPGIARQQHALQTLSPRLRSTEQVPQSFWGTSTEQCVTAGCLWSSVALIHQAQHHHPGALLLLGGGDAQKLHQYFPQALLAGEGLVINGLKDYAQACREEE